jgi:hypothetical protein
MASTAPIDKPTTVPQYLEWLKSKHSVEITPITETYYRTVADRIKGELAASPFWTEWVANLNVYHDQYLVNTGYLLLMPNPKPEVLTKSFRSVLSKSFRQNIVRNERWPDEPAEGWVLPSNWIGKMNDIARTVIAVKYLDGVEFMAEQTKALATKLSLNSRMDFEAKAEGYYAGHLYTYHELEVQKLNWDMERVRVSFEIQITTQLQEVIRLLLHKYYEDRRTKSRSDTKWQWEYRSDEFVANYLGHILHYVEGMIMDVRARQVGGSR